MKFCAFLLCCVSMLAQTQAAAAEKSAFDKATLEAYLRHIELWIPQVTVKIDDAKPSSAMPGVFDVWVHASYNGATKDELYYVSKDGHSVIKGDIYDINRSPFQANLEKLKSTSELSFGPAAAPVTIVVFSDFQCPVCKEEAEVLRVNVVKAFPDKVRVVFQDFPLESIHPWARAASIAGRCVARQDPAKFWDFFDWDYQNQTQITAENLTGKVQEFAAQKGLDGVQLGRCMETKASEAEVNHSIAQGRSLEVDATPTLFLNGRKLNGGVPWQSFEPLIHFELDHQAALAKADDKCCEVNIPKLVK